MGMTKKEWWMITKVVSLPLALIYGATIIDVGFIKATVLMASGILFALLVITWVAYMVSRID